MATQIMATTSSKLRKAASWVMGGAILSASLATPAVARADESSPTGKGIAGGALLGGELVMAIEAAAGVQRPLAYGLGAIGGALAGGVGGYFVEQSVSDAKIPSYMLAGGIALLIPATVMAFNATTYRPPASYQEDQGINGGEPVADAPQGAPGGASPTVPPTTPPPPSAPSNGGSSATPPAQGSVSQAPSKPRVYAFRRRLTAPQVGTPMSVLAWQNDALRFGLPAVEVRPVFSQQELRQYGMAQREEVRVPVFQARF